MAKLTPEEFQPEPHTLDRPDKWLILASRILESLGRSDVSEGLQAELDGAWQRAEKAERGIGDQLIGLGMELRERAEAAEKRAAKLEEEIKGKNCPRCQVDGYWYRYSKIAEVQIRELEVALQAAKPLVWSKEAPKEPGLFWKRWYVDPRAGVTFELVLERHGARFARDMSGVYANVLDLDCEWAGPLPKPMENNQ